MLNLLRKELNKAANPEKAKKLASYFRTGKGQYGEGDVFLGITSPAQREIAKKYSGLDMEDIEELLQSNIHEHRQIALIMLVNKFRKAGKNGRRKIYRFYLENTGRINNWDLVDISAAKIAGEYLLDKDRPVLRKLAKSPNMWERRIAMISTHAFIRKGEFKDAFGIAGILMNDKHDLIHKAVGWMLREIGKKDQRAEEAFLRKHCRTMPRTALRYATERFGKKKRSYYMKQRFT